MLRTARKARRKKGRREEQEKVDECCAVEAEKEERNREAGGGPTDGRGSIIPADEEEASKNPLQSPTFFFYFLRSIQISTADGELRETFRSRSFIELVTSPTHRDTVTAALDSGPLSYHISPSTTIFSSFPSSFLLSAIFSFL